MTTAQMTDEQKKNMETMKEYATPGKNHDVLKQLVGTWKTKLQFHDPNTPIKEVEGTGKTQMILGVDLPNKTSNQPIWVNPLKGVPFMGITINCKNTMACGLTICQPVQ